MYVWCVEGTHVCVMCEGYRCMYGLWRIHMYVWCVEGIDVCVMVCGGYTCMYGVWRV